MGTDYSGATEGIVKPVRSRQISVRQSALEKGVSESGIRRHIKTYKKTGRSMLSFRKGGSFDVGGRPLCLKSWEDEALVRYVTLLCDRASS